MSCCTFQKSFISRQKIGSFVKISALQTNNSFSNFLYFLSHSLFVKYFSPKENARSLTKTVKNRSFFSIFHVFCTLKKRCINILKTNLTIYIRTNTEIIRTIPSYDCSCINSTWSWPHSLHTIRCGHN